MSSKILIFWILDCKAAEIVFFGAIKIKRKIRDYHHQRRLTQDLTLDRPRHRIGRASLLYDFNVLFATSVKVEDKKWAIAIRTGCR